MANILIVDDSMVVQRTLDIMLKKMGHTTCIANDGEQALTMLATEAVDLIISDVHMPGMNGLSLLNEIKGDKKLQHIPVVMLTASGTTLLRERSTIELADNYIPKPVSTHQLAQVLAKFNFATYAD